MNIFNFLFLQNNAHFIHNIHEWKYVICFKKTIRIHKLFHIRFFKSCQLTNSKCSMRYSSNWSSIRMPGRSIFCSSSRIWRIQPPQHLKATKLLHYIHNLWKQLKCCTTSATRKKNQCVTLHSKHVKASHPQHLRATKVL